jgi:hypothetical protein
VVFKKTSTLFEKNESDIKTKSSTQSGGSVSCLALDVLIQFGCNPIFLIGQDLSFPSNRIYSSFSNSNKKMLDNLNHERMLKENHNAETRKSKTIKVESISGNKVETNQAMYSYLRGIEEIATINPKTKIYNLCSHGAQIDNVTSLGSANELMKFLNKY